MKLFSSALMYSGLWRMWAAFVIFFYEWAARFVLYIVWTCVWVRKDQFLLRNRGIRDQVSEIPSAGESVLSAVTRHHVSRLSTACLGGNGGLGVRRREFSLGTKQGRCSPIPVIVWISGSCAGHEPHVLMISRGCGALGGLQLCALCLTAGIRALLSSLILVKLQQHRVILGRE